MPKTRNGWKVEISTLNMARIPGTTHWVKYGTGGRIATAMTVLYTTLNKIEPRTENGWDGTYAYRAVRGTSNIWSEHAAGVAYDHNASQHPRARISYGRASFAPHSVRYAGWSDAQIIAVRKFLASPQGQAFEWGADFRRPDPMHFQLKPVSTWLKLRTRFAKMSRR